MKTARVFLLAALFAFALAPLRLAAQKAPFDRIDSWIRSSYSSRLGDTKIDMSLGGAAIKLLSQFDKSVNLDDRLDMDIKEIDKISIKVYGLRDGADRAFPPSLKKYFRLDDWEKILQVRDDGEQVLVYLKWNSPKRALAAMLVQEKDELVTIAFSGRFRLRPASP